MFSKKSIIVSYTYMLAIPICLMLYAIFPSIRDFVSTIYLIGTMLVIIFCWKDFFKLMQLLRDYWKNKKG
ncbi:hypothetical protein [Streptococcus mutans]|jgi:hypothetical protein|uniref:Uncharacterized protein n=2 Tax=Streptococcus mutans TaxID=1309 RepID=Q8DW10_STRMU|nr:hypothetical protein [Streptococcus mutans]EMB76247.1 hypothetical protein SMU44_09319 [Streptococcus mutans 11VS1]AAN58046.1 hypothetical protein SMU_279 [Streptococcus mutans UA159]AJD54710.1 hypothetical protein SMUFR_0235 [Streptococcus mutans UA159-FR]AMF86096.1 hypothetical protein APQ13_06500 [Streptococcus mutans]ARS61740.1 hypothetical protein RO10_00405 [Streptococcus mutans]